MKRDSILRNAGFALIVRVGGAVMTAALNLFLIRYLGPSVYGALALAISIGGLVLIPSDLGISQATARYIAEAGRDHRLVASVLADSVRLKLIASGLISAVLVALAEPIAAIYNAPEIAWPLRIVAVSILFESLFLMLEASFQALARISAFLKVVFFKSTTEIGLSVGIVLLGGGYGLVVVARLLRPSRITVLRGGSRGNLKRILGYGTALLIVDGAFALFARIDSLMIGQIISVEAVGLYSAPVMLLATFGIVGMAISSGVAPRMARNPGEQPDPRTLEHAIRLLIAVQGLALAPLVVWADPIAEYLLGSEYQASAAVLQALAPYAFMMGISPMLAMSVNYLGEARRRIPIAFLALILNAAINLVLLPRVGIVGAAIGTDIAYAVYLLAHLVLLRSILGLRSWPLLATFVRTLLAALAMAGVLLAGSALDPGLGLLLVAGALATALYAAALVAVGAINRSELGEILARLRPATRG